MLKTIKTQLKGLSLITHNGQLADPRNKFTKALKEVTGKRKKTDADHDEVARLEFLASCYTNGHDLVVPSYVVEATILNGAKKTRQGPQCKAGVFVEEDGILNFEGKPSTISEQTLSELFEQGNHHLTVGVKVQSARVMRTRPLFRNWDTTVDITYEDDLVNRSQVLQFLGDAGAQVGIGDWRPKYGRFSVNVLEG